MTAASTQMLATHKLRMQHKDSSNAWKLKAPYYITRDEFADHTCSTLLPFLGPPADSASGAKRRPPFSFAWPRPRSRSLWSL